jgi:hypothetical protein
MIVCYEPLTKRTTHINNFICLTYRQSEKTQVETEAFLSSLLIHLLYIFAMRKNFIVLSLVNSLVQFTFITTGGGGVGARRGGGGVTGRGGGGGGLTTGGGGVASLGFGHSRASTSQAGGFQLSTEAAIMDKAIIGKNDEQ